MTAVGHLSADGLSKSILSAIERSLAAMGTYEVEFTISVDDSTGGGVYAVSGNDFYLRADGVEVYTENGVRRQINHAAGEIAVDAVDMAANDFISNPTRGFVALLEAFDATAAEQDGGGYAITLAPRAGDDALSYDSIIIYTDAEAKYPERILYVSEAGTVSVRLARPRRTDGEMPRFSAEKYPDFETIDYR